MTYKDMEKMGMCFHGAEPCPSPTIAGWALGNLGDPTLEAYRIVRSPDTCPICLLKTQPPMGGRGRQGWPFPRACPAHV